MRLTRFTITIAVLVLGLMFLYPTTQLAQQRVPPTTGMSRDSSETNSQGQAPAKEKEQFIVKFTEKVSPKEVSSLVKRSRIKAKELLYEFQDEQGDVITGGYTVPEGEDIDSSLQNMLTKHKAFLSEAIATTDEGLATETDQVAIPGLKKLKKQFRKMLDDAQNGRFTLSGLKAAGGSELSKIKAMPHVQSVLPVPVMPGAERQAESARVQFMPASYWHESWAPYYGTAKVTQGFTMQTFYFNNVGGFGSTSTYEHETQVYNRNFADYGYYWSSNLPSAYYDTPFADTLDNFTIGTSRASSLQNYTQYYTYMALRPGTSSSATVRIKGQKGYRWPTWCYSTWCIYPQATTTSMTTFTAPIYYTLPYNY